MSIIASSAFLAFSIALPFGPVSLMCVQRSVMSGALRRLACGAGASTAHGFFAILAVVGANAVAGWLTDWQAAIHFASSIVLIAIGFKMTMKAVQAAPCELVTAGGLRDYLAGLMLALTNSGTVIPYLGLAGSGLLIGRNGLAALTATALGVIVGSVAWYATLSGSAWALRERLPRAFLSRLNFVAGPALVLMGLHLVLSR